MGAGVEGESRKIIRGKFTVDPGAAMLLLSAMNHRSDPRFDCLLDGGDLSQMAAQKRFLVGEGIDVGQRDVYPAVRQEDYARALRLIFENGVEGWWNLERPMVTNKVCSPKEFREKLKCRE